MKREFESDLISVIIPMYNSSETIERTLISVKNQTYKLFEIIVIDDGSTDDSYAVVSQFKLQNPALNILIIRKPNGGVSSARNLGMSNSTGGIIALLDADDEWLPNKLSRQMEVLNCNPEIDFLGCARNGEKLIILFKEINSLHRATVEELFYKMYPQTSTALFRRYLFDQYGGYNESMTHAEDGNLWIRYCAKSNFYYLPEFLVITGGGKPSFGFAGLSANLKEMQLGNEYTLREARQEGMISETFYWKIFLLDRMKYIRRHFITFFREFRQKQVNSKD